MKKPILSLICMFLIATGYAQQQNVSIGTTQTKANAILWVKGDGIQGLLLPTVASRLLFNPGADEGGMLIYETSSSKVYYWNGSSWIEVSGGGSGSGSDSQTLTINGNALSISGGNAIGVAEAAPTQVGQLLMWNGTRWTSSSTTAPTANGQVLKWNNTTKTWEAGTEASAGALYTAGTGINIAGTVISNTGDADASNDLTTSSVAGGDLTGTYPNPTIAANAITAAKLAPNLSLTTTGSITVNSPGAITGNGSGLTSISATSISSGVLGIARGGTGLATTPANGQILVGNGTGGYALNTLTAGSGINIAAAAGTLTISNTASASNLNALTDAAVATPSGGQVLVYNGTADFQNMSLSGDIASVSNTGSVTIANNAITAAKLQSDASNNALRAVSANHIQDGAVTASKLPNNISINTTGNLTTTGTGALSIAGNASLNGPATLAGPITLTPLGGAGTRMVVADNTGLLSAQPLPGSGFSTANIVPKGDGTTLVASSIFDNGSNVGIGTLSPGATLDVSSPSPTMRLSSTSGVSTSAASSLEFSNALSGTIGSIADAGSSDHLQISSFVQGLLFNTNFSTRMTIDNNGNVGIGISPAERLDVAGRTRFSDGNTINGFSSLIENNIAASGQSSGALQVLNSGPRTVDNEAMSIENRATTSTGSSSTKTGLAIRSTGTWTGTGLVNRGLFVDVAGGTTNYSAIFNGGNVGIGTAAPEESLDVIGYMRIGAGTGSANEGLLLATPAAGFSSIIAGGRATNQFQISQPNNASMTFLTNGAERMRIDGAGNVGIGTSPGYPLHIAVPTTSYALRIDQNTGTGDGQLIYVNTLQQSRTLLSVQSNTLALEVRGDGHVGVGRVPLTNNLEVNGTASKAAAGDWVANSDRRIKTDIHDIDNSLDIIKKLHPVKFRYTNEWKKRNPSIKDQYYYNFIAQEFQQVFPEAVQGSGEFIEGDKKEILQIDTYNAQIVAIRAIQEQQKIIETQQEEIDTLKKELNAIKDYLGIEAKVNKKRKSKK